MLHQKNCWHPISSILDSIKGISIATEESANGTTNIANRTVSIAERSSVVNDNSKTAEERANKLSEGVAKFKFR